MSPPATAGAGSGFPDPVLDAQAAFRLVMTAMSQPGRIESLKSTPDAPPGLGRAMAAIALSLCDYATPVWLDESLQASRAVGDFLRLHAGARLCDAPHDAAFAFVSSWRQLPDLASFAIGTPAFPDASTTIVLETERLEPVAGWRLTGPGIATESFLDPGPMPVSFEAWIEANRQLYPRGVDLLLCCGDRIAALPRSTRIERGG